MLGRRQPFSDAKFKSEQCRIPNVNAIMSTAIHNIFPGKSLNFVVTPSYCARAIIIVNVFF